MTSDYNKYQSRNTIDITSVQQEMIHNTFNQEILDITSKQEMIHNI